MKNADMLKIKFALSERERLTAEMQLAIDDAAGKISAALQSLLVLRKAAQNEGVTERNIPQSLDFGDAQTLAFSYLRARVLGIPLPGNVTPLSACQKEHSVLRSRLGVK